MNTYLCRIELLSLGTGPLITHQRHLPWLRHRSVLASPTRKHRQRCAHFSSFIYKLQAHFLILTPTINNVWKPEQRCRDQQGSQDWSHLCGKGMFIFWFVGDPCCSSSNITISECGDDWRPAWDVCQLQERSWNTNSTGRDHSEAWINPKQTVMMFSVCIYTNIVF